jgi:hypothetical protein
VLTATKCRLTLFIVSVQASKSKVSFAKTCFLGGKNERRKHLS